MLKHYNVAFICKGSKAFSVKSRDYESVFAAPSHPLFKIEEGGQWQPSPQKTKTSLVVTTSEYHPRSAEIFLKQWSYRIPVAEDGFDALSKINDFKAGHGVLRHPDAQAGRLTNLRHRQAAMRHWHLPPCHAVAKADSEPLRQGLSALQKELSGGADRIWLYLVGIALAVLLVILGGWGLVRLQLMESVNRRRAAENLQQETKRQEQETKRLNDANQAAILRLMNELQLVAEGDLTQEATVTEDITGAIADTVNYTVEELRMWWASVQNTASPAGRIRPHQRGSTSTSLLAASTEQLREIRETERIDSEPWRRVINQVSSQRRIALGGAPIALAADGLKGGGELHGGMNSIRRPDPGHLQTHQTPWVESSRGGL
ncbi:hypothetical protein FQA39_LY18981 [Lamprigera yunnana]|nr:hypothetical protein FQA39_LY18981 [Lamprigera yunnana]